MVLQDIKARHIYAHKQIGLHLLKIDVFLKATCKLEKGTDLYTEIPEHQSSYLF